MIRKIFRFRGRYYDRLRKAIGTACHLVASCMLFFLYPVVIAGLFPELEMTFQGNILIFILLLIHSIVPTSENQQNRTTMYNRVG